MNYYNSTLSVKRKRCSSCGTNTIIFSKGRCKYCSIKEDTHQKQRLCRNKYEDEALEGFFKNAAIEIAKHPFCWECKTKISPEYYRHATAHLLPKRLFRSVAAHPSNYLILGFHCGCHSKSEVWSNFEKMRTWGIAVEKFKILYPLLLPYEHQFIPPELLKYV